MDTGHQGDEVWVWRWIEGIEGWVRSAEKWVRRLEWRIRRIEGRIFQFEKINRFGEILNRVSKRLQRTRNKDEEAVKVYQKEWRVYMEGDELSRAERPTKLEMTASSLDVEQLECLRRLSVDEYRKATSRGITKAVVDGDMIRKNQSPSWSLPESRFVKVPLILGSESIFAFSMIGTEVQSDARC